MPPPDDTPAPRLPEDAVPGPVLRVLETLRGAGHEAVLVGGCVRDLVRGAPVADFDVATSAPPGEMLRLFPRAIPIGLRHGTVMVPTRAGPVDVTQFRAGASLKDDLAHRDFTVNALAWDPHTGAVIDPFGGLADLDAGRLRAVGDPDARLSEDPLRILRGARLVAALGLSPDPELEAAMVRGAPRLVAVAPERIRRELEGLLAAPDPRAALELLTRTGAAQGILGGPLREDAAAVAAALPAGDPVLRLAAWLRGLPAESVLARLRFPRRTVRRVARLLARHPVDRHVDPARPVAVRRLLARLGPEDTRALLRLRDAELRAGRVPEPERETARERLAALQRAVEEALESGTLSLRREDLALGGRDVMRLLGTGPGPHVGRALEHLTECVLRDPACNTPEALRERLLAWWQQQEGAAARSAGGETGREGAT